MQREFDITRQNRKILAGYLKNYSLEQLNKVPEGFSNNLIWNIAHIIVVQQMLVYNLSGLPMLVSNEVVAKYKKGTRPETDVTQEEVDKIQLLLFETTDQTQKDFQDKIFEKYTEFTTMTGFAIRSVDDAIAFNYFHEATHLGMMMMIRKFL